MATATRHITIREVAQAVAAADPSVLLVSPRILHRVIRFDRRLPTFGLNIPHRKSYFLSRDRLFNFVSRFELELDVDYTLPDAVILLEKPDEEELLERPPPEVLNGYWRHLFHVRVHLAYEKLIDSGRLDDDGMLERLVRIGSGEYAEIRSVLQRDDMLLPPRTDLSTYVEFAAVFLELTYFAPQQLAFHFPAIRDPKAIAELLSEDINHSALYEATRVPGAADLVMTSIGEESLPPAESADVEILNLDPLKPSPPSYWRMVARAEKVGSLGNVVKAAILRKKAARLALPDRVNETESLANAELERLARRLRGVLGLNDEETRNWAQALIPLLEHAAQGMRSPDARLLYDLQKVCVEQERGVYSIEVLNWIKTRGRAPLRRPLPLLRQVLMTKHLQSAARKLSKSHLDSPNRARLSSLIQSAVERAKLQLRDRVRPRIVEALTAEGFTPSNVPEKVAYNKIVEELLDRIVERGYLDLGLLRDTLSQNQLKLPDLTSLWELLFGDVLLRIDMRLSRSLDRIYHRGPIYLRMSQRLSAMAFGTSLGRSLTRYVALPFGGAFLIFESVQHIVHLFTDRQAPMSPEFENVEQLTSVSPRASDHSHVLDVHGGLAIFALGLFLLLLIESSAVRAWCRSALQGLGKTLKAVFIELPKMLLKWSWIRKLLDSVWYGVFVNYLFKPLVFTACVVIPYEHRFGQIPWGTATIAFLAINLFVNSPLGRYADVLITEQIVRGWRELQMRIFAGVVRMVLDAFQWTLHTMEQVLYTVDEWLRFRSGENPGTVAVKAVLGVFWSVITYVVRIYVTLLIEPQVNPIKHFPVVTVSHKIMLPFSIQLTRLLAAPLMPLGPFWANMIAGTTVFLLPGVFGFLVWELKENWRLYASNRSRTLRPVPIGSHSETMAGLLRVGFHSGTVPRLYTKLRRAGRTGGKWKTFHKHRTNLHHVEEAIHRFIDRELLGLLVESKAWREHDLQVGQIHVACHRASVDIVSAEHPAEPLKLLFEERSGWLLASISDPGWFSHLDPTRQDLVMSALRGIYKYAGADLLWEHLDARLHGRPLWVDFNSDGIQIWPDADYDQSTLIKLRETGAAATLSATPREIVEPTPEEMEELVFRKLPVSWDQWVAMWDDVASSHSEKPGEVAIKA